MYILPDDLRDILKEPIGRLLDEKELIDELKDEKYIVSVGDQVTFTLLKHDIEPFICIVDYKTRRGPCSKKVKKLIKNCGSKSFIVDNPPGYITEDLWNVIKYALEDLNQKSIRIEINGEEDLASLAVIKMAPIDVTIIYGLPDKGVLVVKPTEKNKDKVEQALEKM